MITFAVIPRAAIVAAFVWLVSPHQPDLGFGRPATIETLISGSADTPQSVDLQFSHDDLMSNVERVRADLRANGTKISTPSFGG